MEKISLFAWTWDLKQTNWAMKLLSQKINFYLWYQKILWNGQARILSVTISKLQKYEIVVLRVCQPLVVFLARHISILWAIGFCLPARKWLFRDREAEQSESDKFRAISFKWKRTFGELRLWTGKSSSITDCRTSQRSFPWETENTQNKMNFLVLQMSFHRVVQVEAQEVVKLSVINAPVINFLPVQLKSVSKWFLMIFAGFFLQRPAISD